MRTSGRALVSIIVPVYNREEIVVKTLDSLISQKYRPLEILVIDDGSYDDTYKVLCKWAETNNNRDFTVVVLKQDNLGAPVARNRGIRTAKGTYLQFLDSDDTLETPKIAIQVAALEQSNCDVAICDFRYIDNTGSSMSEKVVLNDGALLSRVAAGWSLYTSTPLIRAKLVKSGIQWNEKLRRTQDIDFLFRVIMLSSKYVYTPGVWCNYFLHSGSQISDSYSLTNPQFISRIESIVEFLIIFRKTLSLKRKVLTYAYLMYLCWLAVRHSIKTVMVWLRVEKALLSIKQLTLRFRG